MEASHVVKRSALADAVATVLPYVAVVVVIGAMFIALRRRGAHSAMQNASAEAEALRKQPKAFALAECVPCSFVPSRAPGA